MGCVHFVSRCSFRPEYQGDASVWTAGELFPMIFYAECNRKKAHWLSGEGTETQSCSKASIFQVGAEDEKQRKGFLMLNDKTYPHRRVRPRQ